ncbi:MAG TPA: hypothetical protein PKA04_06525 [Marmoricola sp.]|nr:hypothetical protein [Marmoricola sp.]
MNVARLGGVSKRRPSIKVLVVIGCLSLLVSCGEAKPPKAAPEPTPLAELKVDQAIVPTIDFCKFVHPKTVSAALGLAGEELPTEVESTAYGNGDEVSVDGTAPQRLQELGCTWKLGSATASAWIFARPVDEAFAQTVISTAKQRKACTTNTGGFGPTSYSQTCPNADGSTRIRHASLIGHTWFTCEISSATETAARADLWCSSLVNELKTN